MARKTGTSFFFNQLYVTVGKVNTKTASVFIYRGWEFGNPQTPSYLLRCRHYAQRVSLSLPKGCLDM